MFSDACDQPTESADECAAGSTPRAALHFWMHSDTHRATILNPQLQETGIGVAVGSADPSHASITPAATYVQTFGTCSS